MIIRRAQERSLTELSGFSSKHTFSFGDASDVDFQDFGVLRALNENVLAPGGSFGMHFHENMEILSFVLEGTLQHKDSLGNGSVIRPGEIQRMTAGTGVRHNEFNASSEDTCRFLQIWITPHEKDLTPGYEQRSFLDRRRPNKLILLASPNGEDESVVLRQNTSLFYLKLNKNVDKVEFSLKENRSAWIHICSGALMVENLLFEAGDGLGVEGPRVLRFSKGNDAQLLLIEMESASKDLI